MPTKRIEITPEVRAVLDRGSWEGEIFRLPDEQLPRPLYQSVNRVLVALGGAWSRRFAGHVFPGDKKAELVTALEAGGVVDQKRSLEQFFTPADLAGRMVAALDISADHRVLEPSAGNGRLCWEALERGAKVTAVERDPDLALALAEDRRFWGVWAGDFMEYEAAELFDRVLMNPPFSRGQDIAHVTRAFGFLRPGGKLAAIMSPHFTFAQDRASREFRELIGFPGPEALRDNQIAAVEIASPVVRGAVQLLPAGSFKAEGTNVASVLVLVEKAR